MYTRIQYGYTRSIRLKLYIGFGLFINNTRAVPFREFSRLPRVNVVRNDINNVQESVRKFRYDKTVRLRQYSIFDLILT